MPADSAVSVLLPPRFDAMPDELKAVSHWVVWRAEPQPDKGKFGKIPVDAKFGDRPGSSTNPATWADFATARRCYERYPGKFGGVGFVVSESDPFVGIDLDHVIDSERRVSEDAQAIIATMASYTEVSPSGTGVRIFIAATLPPGGRKKGNTELYETGRFLTLTGRRLPGTPSTVVCRQQAIEQWHASVFPPPPPREPGRVVGSGMINTSDCDILSRALTAKNGHEIGALYGGDSSAYHSGSEANLALASKLAFWTGPNHAALDRLMRNSAILHRKWDERHYADGSTWGEVVIRKAIEICSEFYQNTDRTK